MADTLIFYNQFVFLYLEKLRESFIIPWMVTKKPLAFPVFEITSLIFSLFAKVLSSFIDELRNVSIAFFNMKILSKNHLLVERTKHYRDLLLISVTCIEK